MKLQSILVFSAFLITTTISTMSLAATEILQVWSTTATPVETSSALEDGVEYLIEASGTFTYSSGGRIADAEFSLALSYGGPAGWFEANPGNPEYVLDLLVNGSPLDWLGSSDGINFSPHTYSPDHVYRFFLIGEGLPISFVIYDTSYAWNDGYLTVSISPVIEPVSIDIKPNSCPNPLNIDPNGILTVAVHGASAFDISTIDTASVRLEGVAPIRSSVEDIVTPVLNPQSDCECNSDGPDGFDDLVLKFRESDVGDALGELQHGDVVELLLTGNLIDGTPIEGYDCIVGVGNKGSSNPALSNSQRITQ
jgi:hypothetical protein